MAISVLVGLERLEAGDVETGFFWLRRFRAAYNFELDESEAGAAQH